MKNAKEKSIGEVIKDIVTKRKMSPTEFADKICCKRNNVYNIFKRNNINILQLKKIGEILNFNFFEYLSQNLDLIKEIEESDATQKEQAIYSLILEEIPEILKEIKREDMIIFTPQNPKYPTPDFGLINHNNISFTINDTLEKRIGVSNCFPIERLKSKTGLEIEVCTIKRLENNTLVPFTKIINVTIDKVYKKEELKDLLQFAFNIYDSL